jgi:hypothetical protein
MARAPELNAGELLEREQGLGMLARVLHDVGRTGVGRLVFVAHWADGGTVDVLGRAGRDAKAVCTATRGNPFFVTELLAGPEGELPLTVRDGVLARGSLTDAESRALLDLVSLVPTEAELWLLEQASESGP